MITQIKARRISDGDFRRIMKGDTDLNWYNAQIQRATAHTRKYRNKRKKDKERLFVFAYESL